MENPSVYCTNLITKKEAVRVSADQPNGCKNLDRGGGCIDGGVCPFAIVKNNGREFTIPVEKIHTIEKDLSRTDTSYKPIYPKGEYGTDITARIIHPMLTNLRSVTQFPIPMPTMNKF